MKNYVIVILCLIIIALYVGITKNKNRVEDANSIITQLNSDLSVVRNSLGQEISSRESLQLLNTTLLLDLKSKDYTIQKLQELVAAKRKENKDLNSAIIILNNTLVNYEDSVLNFISDTVIIDNEDYPTYKRNIDNFDKWITGSVELGITKFNIDLSIYNEYGVSLYSEKKGLFKPRKNYVEVINFNPYTSTSDIRNFEVKPKENKKGPFIVGFVAGVGSTILLKKLIE